MDRRRSSSPQSRHPASNSRVDPLDWARSADAADLVEQEMRACVRRRRAKRISLLGGASVLALVALLWMWPGNSFAPTGPAELGRARVAAPERRILSDGSTLEFKPGAAVTVDFSPGLRRVVLDRGEAHFQVAKNPARPFVVVARGVEIRAVGTAFSVGLESSRVEVLVTEGQVAVETSAAPALDGGQTPAVQTLPPSDGSSPGVMVRAGERVTVDTSAAAPVLPAAQTMPVDEMNDRLAWRVPWLEMNATPLSEIIAAFNLHSGSRLSYADARLGRLTLSGTLRADNVTVLLQILDTSYGVTAEKGADGAILLVPTR